MDQGGIRFRPASYVNFTKALPSRKPKTVAEEGKDAMMTADHSRRPVKAPQSDGVFCPKCGSHHRPGTVCNWDKSFEYRRVLDEITKGGTNRHPKGAPGGKGGQFAPKGTGLATTGMKHSGPGGGGKLQSERKEIKQAPGTETTDSSRIHDAYNKLTQGQYNQQMSLDRLRAEVPDMSREQVDSALMEMFRSGDAILFPEDNTRQLSSSMEEGALHLAGEPKHYVKFEGAPRASAQSTQKPPAQEQPGLVAEKPQATTASIKPTKAPKKLSAQEAADLIDDENMRRIGAKQPLLTSQEQTELVARENQQRLGEAPQKPAEQIQEMTEKLEGKKPTPQERVAQTDAEIYGQPTLPETEPDPYASDLPAADVTEDRFEEGRTPQTSEEQKVYDEAAAAGADPKAALDEHRIGQATGEKPVPQKEATPAAPEKVETEEKKPAEKLQEMTEQLEAKPAEEAEPIAPEAKEPTALTGWAGEQPIKMPEKKQPVSLEQLAGAEAEAAEPAPKTWEEADPLAGMAEPVAPQQIPLQELAAQQGVQATSAPQPRTMGGVEQAQMMQQPSAVPSTPPASSPLDRLDQMSEADRGTGKPEEMQLMSPTEQLQEMTQRLRPEPKQPAWMTNQEQPTEQEKLDQLLTGGIQEHPENIPLSTGVTPAQMSEWRRLMEQGMDPGEAARQALGKVQPIEVPKGPRRITPLDLQGQPKQMHDLPIEPRQPRQPRAPRQPRPYVPRTPRDGTPPMRQPRSRQIMPGLSQMFGTGQAIGSGMFTPGGTAGPTGSAVVQGAHALLSPGTADTRARYIQPQRQPAVHPVHKSLIDWKDRYERRKGTA